jgi:hypothetical protein
MEGFPGWQTDPTGRHQERYFDSAGVPTGLVRNDGFQFIDDRAASGIQTTGNSSPMRKDGKPAPRFAEQPTGQVDGDTVAHTDSLLASLHKSLGPSDHYSQPVAPAPAVIQSGPPAIVRVRPRRNRWLIATACVLAVLLIVASVIAVQQHNVANKWMNGYHAEVKDYNAEVHRNQALYATLVSKESLLSSVANQK